MCQDDTGGTIFQSDHPFNSYDRKYKCCLYVYHWMKLIRFLTKILAASDKQSDYTMYAAFGWCHSTCTGENSACITGLQKETNV